MTPVALTLSSVLLGVVGQLLLKAGMGRVGPLRLGGTSAVAVARRMFSVPQVWGGLSLYGVAMLFWLAALSRLELSYVYPFLSLSYVLIVLAARLFLREAVSPTRVVGVAAICLGVFLIARGS